MLANISDHAFVGISNIDQTVRVRLGYYPVPATVSLVELRTAAFGVRCLEPGESFTRTVRIKRPLSIDEMNLPDFSRPVGCAPTPSYRIEIPWTTDHGPSRPFRTPAGRDYRARVFLDKHLPQQFVISPPQQLPPELMVTGLAPCTRGDPPLWYDAEHEPNRARPKPE